MAGVKVLLRSEVEPSQAIVPLIEDAGCQIVRWNPSERCTWPTY